MANPKDVDFLCDTCGSEMKNRGESANPHYLVIECPVCGQAFLLSKKILQAKK